MVLDVPITQEPNPDDENEKEYFSHTGDNGTEELDQLHIGQLLQSLLQDAQTRLFFKAQAFVQSDIQHYVPKAIDLNHLEPRSCEY